jgi:hypothetical protein
MRFLKFLRLLVLWIGVTGSLIFAVAFAASFTSDHFISETARTVIHNRVAQGGDETADLLSNNETRLLDVEAKFVREFRVFTGTNAIISFILVGAALHKRRNRVLLVPAATVLLLASAITGYAYLFNQTWLMAMLYGDYVGYVYIAYVAFVLFLLVDFLRYRGRITAEVLDGIFGNLTNVFSSLDGC